ncbi:MAG: ABC transporter ATP-binding protein [Jatrophihabitans sp.]
MLEITDLHKRYGSTTALDGITLSVAPGEMYGFVGANGAGKSTTMRIAMGVLAADAGTVRWSGGAVSYAIRRRFGYMPEQRGLYPKMRIAEQVAYFGRLHGMPVGRANESATALLQRLEVKAESTDQLQALSLGNQQRVQLAAALVHRPELLILDEPFSGLDPIGVDTMSAVLAEQCAAGVAVMFSSHQLELVEQLCDRIGIIVDGAMVAQGSIDELRAAADARELEVEVAVVGDSWLTPLAGVRISARDGDVFRLVLQDPADDQAVLAAAAGAGRVARFGWRQPPLSELYRSAVSA